MQIFDQNPEMQQTRSVLLLQSAFCRRFWVMSSFPVQTSETSETSLFRANATIGHK